MTKLKPPPTSVYGATHGDCSLLFAIYSDYAAHEEAGEYFDLDAFLQKYPHLQDDIINLVAKHKFLVENADCLKPKAAHHLSVAPEEIFQHLCIIEELGSGGFAQVVLAADAKLGGKPCVVKYSYLGGIEAIILGPLRHRNLVAVEAIYNDDESGLSAVCMPYRGRTTLADVGQATSTAAGDGERARALANTLRDPLLPNERLPAWFRRRSHPEMVRVIAIQIAEALQYIHEHNICHRDLKPTNVLITPDGTPLLIDFNLATGGFWAKLQMGGSYLYMAPELLEIVDSPNPQIPEPDPRTDIFSFGVLLYELLGCQHPFSAAIDSGANEVQQRQQLLQRQKQPLTPLKKHCPKADRHLCRVVERSLAYRAEDRYQSMAEMLHDLRRVPLRRRVVHGVFRYPLTAAGIVLSAAFILAFCGYSALAMYQINNAYDFGLREYQNGNHAQAVDQFTVAIKHGINRDDAYSHRARAFKELARTAPNGNQRAQLLENGIKDLEFVANRNPAGSICARLGFLFHLKGEVIAAKSCYVKSIAREFATPGVLNNLAAIQLQQNNLPTALKNLDSALERNPDLPRTRHIRALVHYRLWQQIRQRKISEKEKERRMNLHLEQAVEDILLAIQLGKPSGDLYADGANIIAAYSVSHPLHRDRALEFVKQAIRHGADAEQFRLEFTFRQWQNDSKFQEALRNRVQFPGRRRAALIIDPAATE